MRDSAIRVSVIVPTYKRETALLMRAMQSLKNQTYPNVEIVVVDDNIPDSEDRKKVMAFMKQFEDDPDVTYVINPKNVGGSLARNNGIQAASGSYITFLDDDDEYLPEKIERQLAFMLAEECDMSFTDLTLVNNNKVVVDYREYPDLKGFDQMTLLKYHLMRHLTGTPTFMYKAEKLKEIGGFEDAIMGQEFYLMLKSIENNLTIRYLNESHVIAYRHGEGGISKGKNKIIGVKKEFKFKQNYFHLFTASEKRFIRFRYNAVLAVSHVRNKNYIYAVGRMIAMVLSSPADLVRELYKYIKKVAKKRTTKEN